MNDIDAIFDSVFNNRGVIFDRLYHKLNHVNPSNFPPHNIIKKDDELILSLAVAGYGKDNLSITVEDRILKISGNLPDDKNLNYIYKGIAGRKFTRSFVLDEYLEVVGAEYVDGMLHIKLKYIIPDDKKPKQIPISDADESIKKLEAN